MNIKIVIEDNNGEQLFLAKCLSVESAVQELYRFERNQEREMEKLDEIKNDSIK